LVLTDDLHVFSVSQVPRRFLPQPDWVLDHRRQLGERIRSLRRERRLSQDQLAERAGIARRSVQRAERAERDPGYGDLLLIASALDVPIAALLRES
jgi:DNA-binding XRE family transcriptional regulator